MKRLVPLLGCVLLCSCATRPRQYAAPDPGKLNNSTAHYEKAVGEAHQLANAARANVKEAQDRQKQIEQEMSLIAEVPPTLRQKVEDQDKTLEQAANNQSALDAKFTEADAAKVWCREGYKADYFAAAKKIG